MAVSEKNYKTSNERSYEKQSLLLRLIYECVAAVALATLISIAAFYLMELIFKNKEFLYAIKPFFIIAVDLLIVIGNIRIYLLKLRKFENDNQSDGNQQATKKDLAYLPILDHARKEGLIDKNNNLLQPRTDFIRFCVKNKYFFPYRKSNWKAIDGVLTDEKGAPISAEQITQSFQDIQSRVGIDSK